jgi:hypothetical protein
MVTSHTDRTSPVLRGKWILENLLGAPPPAPPANVPPLNENPQREGKVLTMRERMEEHRANPVCANCHKLMDPIGLSMENFDAIGAWRTRDGNSVSSLGTAIDTSGELLDGTKVDGVAGLRNALMRQPDIFVNTLTEKLLIYALGRGLGYYDMPAVRSILRESAKQDFRFSSLILEIVRSTPFQKRMTPVSDVGGPAGSKEVAKRRTDAIRTVGPTSRTTSRHPIRSVDHVYDKETYIAPCSIARHGRDDSTSIPRGDGARTDSYGQDRRKSVDAFWSGLCTARRKARLLDALESRR